MLLTSKFLNETDPRSPLARRALRQSGDGARIRALRTMLLSIGCCELTPENVKTLGAVARERRFSFMSVPLSFVPLKERDFERFPRILAPTDDIDRCILIGRNALNFRLYPRLFATGDCDIMCPDLDNAVKCARILESLGFRRDGATFVSKNGAELDLIIGSSKDPPGPLLSFYNAPELSPL